MSNVLSLAQDLYDAAACDAAFRAFLLQARIDLLKKIASGESYGLITNGSKNGGSYSMQVDVSTSDRREALKLAVNGLNAGVRPGSTTFARFA